MSDIFEFIDQMVPHPEVAKFDFKTQMVIGDRGEAEFIKYYASLGPKKSSDLAYDFTLNDGRTVELKTDDYPMERTRNFFMETVSDIKSGKLGGPFRAHKDGVTFFVYYFMQNRMFFWFETAKLYPVLKEIIDSDNFTLKIIKNRTWTSHGYAIPRHCFDKVLFHQDSFPLDFDGNMS